MCYNNCIHERFNPMTGDCRCLRGSKPCPEEMTTCPTCDTAFEEHFETCPNCEEEM